MYRIFRESIAYFVGAQVSWARTYTCEMICSSSELFLFFAGSMIVKLSPCSTHIRIMLCLIVYVWNNALASLYRFGTMHLNEQSVLTIPASNVLCLSRGYYLFFDPARRSLSLWSFGFIAPVSFS
jgi:hypothetical protein